MLGGLCQLLFASMWEFRNKNVFGATAFSTYGGFWIGVGLWLHFIAPTAAHPLALNRDLGWILLAFAIFNTYMLIISTQVNAAVFLVFATLELTEIALVIGNFTAEVRHCRPTPPARSGSSSAAFIGIITALVAWYASAAGVMNGHKGRAVFPSRQAAVRLVVRPSAARRAGPGTSVSGPARIFATPGPGQRRAIAR